MYHTNLSNQRRVTMAKKSLVKRSLEVVLFGMVLTLGLTLTGCEMDEESGNSPGSAITLTEGQWTSGNISEFSKNNEFDVDWYTFTATAEKIYRIQWADSGQYGAYTPVPTCNINVTAYQSDKTTVLFSTTMEGYSPARAILGYAGTVYLEVEGYDFSSGTYAIRYYEEGDAIVSLAADTWVNAMLDKYSEEDLYTFTAQAGTTYSIQWADSGQYGVYTPAPTCDINVTAYQSDKATTFFSNAGSAFTTPKTISGYSGTVYLKVNSWHFGTYAIRYTTTP
jgi:hypothetical protein